ncbi:hypothetical protein VNO77_34074 [Canavalia gladiata]|uniref:Uncharacterized protein n=1 Tax=Canavalia gladiata TaxID=3824 RepID=A0AAN9KEI1_CANGL
MGGLYHLILREWKFFFSLENSPGNPPIGRSVKNSWNGSALIGSSSGGRRSSRGSGFTYPVLAVVRIALCLVPRVLLILFDTWVAPSESPLRSTQKFLVKEEIWREQVEK